MICEEAWEKFCLYGFAIMRGSKDYNAPNVHQGMRRKGSTVFGNKNADIFDVFNFWREEILDPPGHPYTKEYLDQIVDQAIREEPWLPIPQSKP